MSPFTIKMMIAFIGHSVRDAPPMRPVRDEVDMNQILANGSAAISARFIRNRFWVKLNDGRIEILMLMSDDHPHEIRCMHAMSGEPRDQSSVC